jgi:hypothetical protein
VSPRENLIIGQIGKRLARKFASHHMSETLRASAKARFGHAFCAGHRRAATICRQLALIALWSSPACCPQAKSPRYGGDLRCRDPACAARPVVCRSLRNSLTGPQSGSDTTPWLRPGETHWDMLDPMTYLQVRA